MGFNSGFKGLISFQITSFRRLLPVLNRTRPL